MFDSAGKTKAPMRVAAALAIVTVMLTVGCSSGGGLSADIREVIEAPIFKYSPWAISVADMESGEVLESYNPDIMLDPASTNKLFVGASALEVLGKDHKFSTPVYAVGDLGPAGSLAGDLVLVASGDISIGGRTLPDGTIEFTPQDHTDANALGNCVLTKTDPLAGIDDLVRQVAASGVKTVAGDVIIDDRLYGPGRPFDAELDYDLTPIMINDNLIDIIMQPGQEGEPASVDWRPKSSAYRVVSEVATGPAGSETQVEIASSAPGVITVRGQIPAGGGEIVNTFTVEDPASFARTVMIEALARAGVTVRAQSTGTNPSEKLPADYSGMRQVALLESPPFSEFAKLILKVSHNPGADTFLFLMAASKGGKTMEEGLAVEKEFLEKAGVDTAGLVINDGQGSFGADFIAPSATLDLLRYMSKSDDFDVYFNCLPVMGEDGTLANLMKDSPVKGKVQAKTGTHGGPNNLNQGLWVSRALAGYMTARSGRKLVYDIVVGQVPASGMEDMQSISEKHARVLELVYDKY